mgnify:CR=1 FL=1|jgi:nitrogenase subunit NifH
MTVAQLIEKIKTYDQDQDINYSITFLKIGDVISEGFMYPIYGKGAQKGGKCSCNC